MRNLFTFFSNSSPLHEYARELDSSKLLNELKLLHLSGELEAKVDGFFQYNQVQETPLCLALNHDLTAKDLLTCIKYLLLFGASPNLNTYFASGKIANAPIHEAARKHNLDAIAMLVLAGANLYQIGTLNVQVHTLLETSGGYTPNEYSLLKALENTQKELMDRQKTVEIEKQAQNDRIKKTISAYEKLIAVWQNCQCDKILNQLSKEGTDCMLDFIQGKITLLKYDLYEFIVQQFYDLIPGELANKLNELLTDILEYRNINKLPVIKEHLAAHLAVSISQTTNQPSLQETNDGPIPMEYSNYTACAVLRRRQV